MSFYKQENRIQIPLNRIKIDLTLQDYVNQIYNFNTNYLIVANSIIPRMYNTAYIGTNQLNHLPVIRINNPKTEGLEILPNMVLNFDISRIFVEAHGIRDLVTTFEHDFSTPLQLIYSKLRPDIGNFKSKDAFEIGRILTDANWAAQKRIYIPVPLGADFVTISFLANTVAGGVPIYNVETVSISPNGSFNVVQTVASNGTLGWAESFPTYGIDAFVIYINNVGSTGNYKWRARFV